MKPTRPDRILKILPVLLIFAACNCSAQEPDGRLSGSVRAHAGLLINRAFSNITEKVEVIDETSSITRTPSDSAGNGKTGFIIGIEMFPGKSEKLRVAFSLSLARSEAVYHSSYVEEGPTNLLGYTHMKRATELDFVESYFYLDIHAGARGRVAPGVYITGGLVFDRPMISKRQSEGYILTTYRTTGSPDTESTVAYLEDVKKKVRGDSNLSFRLRAEYEFRVGEAPASVYLFRNFGFIYTLPWWGFGFSYSLN